MITADTLLLGVLFFCGVISDAFTPLLKTTLFPIRPILPPCQKVATQIVQLRSVRLFEVEADRVLGPCLRRGSSVAMFADPSPDLEESRLGKDEKKAINSYPFDGPETAENFDGEGFAGYLASYALAALASIAVTAAFVKFVLMDY